jgi:NAD(P)-dependent dehydrogenase (short-subunit alcohol dehydrogenase family)
MLRAGLGRWDSPAEALANLERRTPLGRVADPSEIAAAILFLADGDRSSYITGQTLVADGGALARLSTE